MNGPVELRLADGVATITLHRPERRNALDGPAWEGLRDCLDRARRDTAVRAVVLTGGDEFFSAGGDVSSMQGAGGALLAPVERLDVAHAVIRAVVGLDKPVVAAVERYAIGIAWGLALSCDLLVAGRSAYFQAPFAQRGLVADGGVAWHLPRRLGRHRANRHLLLAERLPADAAEAAGLVSHLVPDGTATRAAEAQAAALGSGPRESNALTKSLATRGEELDLHQFLAAERTAVALGGHGADAAEGRSAFTDKRTPEFP